MPLKTFFGFPRTTYENVTKETIAIVGSKAVSKSIHPSFGQKKATRLLRKLSWEYDTHNMHIKCELENFDIVDLGDFDPRTLQIVIPETLKRGARVIILGGDHTTTYYALRNVSIHDILFLDAHLDSEEYTSSFHHGCIVRRLLEEKENTRIKLLGFRGYSTLASEYEYLREKGVNIVSWPVPEHVLVDEISRNEAISIDLDFFDPTSFQAVRVPEVFGADFSEFIYLINRLEKTDAKYFDLVEYAPNIDPGYVCGKKLIQLLLEILALLVRSL